MDNEGMIERMSFPVEDYLRAVEKSRKEERRRWKQQHRQELLEFLGVLLKAVLIGVCVWLPYGIFIFALCFVCLSGS